MELANVPNIARGSASRELLRSERAARHPGTRLDVAHLVRARGILLKDEAGSAIEGLTLYVDAMTPNARRVRFFLSERGVEVTLKILDTGGGEHKTAPYLAKNAFAQIPTLEDASGWTLSESMAICRYLDECGPADGDRLFGDDTKERAEIHMWAQRSEIGLCSAAVEYGHHKHPHFAQSIEQVPRIVEIEGERIQSTYQRLDDQLANSAFIAGASFSAAEIARYLPPDE